MQRVCLRHDAMRTRSGAKPDAKSLCWWFQVPASWVVRLGGEEREKVGALPRATAPLWIGELSLCPLAGLILQYGHLAVR